MSGNSSERSNGVDLSTQSPLEAVTKAVSKSIDPYGVTTSLLNAQVAWMMHPQELARATNALSGDLWALQAHVAKRAMGMPSDDVITPHGDDARFADPIWTESATWDIIKEVYLAYTRRFEDMLFETPGLSDKERRRSAFWVRNWLNMVAPTNFFWLNPVAMEKFVKTNGESLKEGWQNFQRDKDAKNILMVEPDAFETYLEVRNFTDTWTMPGNDAAQGWPAGWEPIAENTFNREYFAGVRAGEKPPAPTAPPAKPAPRVVGNDLD